MGRVTQFQGEPILGRAIRGDALVSSVPLSFWGGYDAERGTIIDQRHPLAGQTAIDRVLVLPSGRGSCSGSGVLLEAILNGTAPAAIVTSRVDPIISLGCILGDELYQTHPALIVICDEDRSRIHTGDIITINEQGLVTVDRT